MQMTSKEGVNAFWALDFFRAPGRRRAGLSSSLRNASWWWLSISCMSCGGATYGVGPELEDALRADSGSSRVVRSREPPWSDVHVRFSGATRAGDAGVELVWRIEHSEGMRLGIAPVISPPFETADRLQVTVQAPARVRDRPMRLGGHDDYDRVPEQKIESAVERLVREHLVACEAAAETAVRAAFRRASSSSSKSTRSKSSRSRSASRRRSREEIADLEERLYEAIARHPGETMAVIAPAAGATPRELNRPATLLRRQGRVRSVGQRHVHALLPDGRVAGHAGARSDGSGGAFWAAMRTTRFEEVEHLAPLLPRRLRDGHHPRGERDRPRSLWLPKERRRQSTMPRSSRSA